MTSNFYPIIMCMPYPRSNSPDRPYHPQACPLLQEIAKLQQQLREELKYNTGQGDGYRNEKEKYSSCKDKYKSDRKDGTKKSDGAKVQFCPECVICNGKKKVKTGKPSTKSNESEREEFKIGMVQCRSRELRGGRLYYGCHCEKRNGLQDDCPRTYCHGQKYCLTRPPKCPPSAYSNGKHLAAKMRRPASW